MASIKVNKERIIKYAAIILSIAISVSIFYFKSGLQKLSGYGYLGIFLINVLGNATIVVPAPAVFASFIAGSIYNPFLVALMSATGASVGEMTGYMAGYGGKVLIKENKNYQKVKGWMKRSGFLTIFILAAIPNPLFDLAGLFAGATNYSLKKYLLATFSGKLIKFMIVSIAGYYTFRF